ncbi:MAG TPA: NUDIX domain-containing protein [Candidatus Paceibacterota bacterium]|nr:NUDIX domain-containing protein [Candidatus Paceibacterota bacterium]
MLTKPIISIVLGSYNRRPFLKKAIRTIRENGITAPYEIVVIDGGSSDGSIRYLCSQKDIITIVQHNNRYANDKKSWGYYMNIALRSCHGTYIVMISDDCLLIPGSIMNAFNLFEKELADGNRIGGIAFYWRNLPYEKMYYVRQTLGHKLSTNHGMYLRSALEEVGYCEEDKYPFYYGDGDLSLKLWKSGYSIIDCKTALVEHFHFATMSIRKRNNEAKELHKKVYMDSWKGSFYDKDIDNQSGKIFLNYSDPRKTYKYFKRTLRYYIGILQSRFGSYYGYERNRPNRLPSVEMLANPLNIKYLLSKFRVAPEQLCIFALIRKDGKILMGLREYVKGRPVWTYPGGRGRVNETLIETLKREVAEEIGVFDITLVRVVGQKDGVKIGDRVYFVECEISSDPRLIEPDKFKEWKWFPIDELPNNIIDSEDIKFLKRLR